MLVARTSVARSRHHTLCHTAHPTATMSKVQVAVRVRPLDKREQAMGCIVRMNGTQTTISSPKDHTSKVCVCVVVVA